MTTTASKLVSLLENPKTSPNHFPHHSQSDVSKTIVSADVIMSFPCLNPFITHCPNVPPTGSIYTWFTPISSHPHPSPNTTFMPKCWWFPTCIMLSLSPELDCILFLLSGMFSSTFSLVYPKLSFRLQSRYIFLQKATLDSQDQVLCSQMTLQSGLEQPISHSSMTAY